MHPTLTRIYETGIVPVVSLTDPRKGVGLARAMHRGGIPILEVTFRTREAADCIAAIRTECPEMILGAGTVLTAEQVDLARDVGAMYVVSPGYDEDVVNRSLQLGLPVIPGIVNATDIQRCLRAGLDVVKFFPSEPMGGLSTIDYLAAPFGQVRFLPAGGIGFENLGQYLRNDHVLACAGGFVARASHIENEEWDTVTALCQKAVIASHGFALAHVGVNCHGEQDAVAGADTLAQLFGLAKKVGNSSVFAGTAVELMKAPGLGTHGHIGFAVNSVERAVAYLKSRGVQTLPDTARFDKDGHMQSMYLADPLEGFALHLVRK